MPQSKPIRTRTLRDPLRLFKIDSEVRDYVRAIRANQGSISLNAILAVNNFVKTCKADGIWSLLSEVGLFTGVDNLNAALVKLKVFPGTSRTLTNNNFVSGDFVSTGSGAGLKGNASNKSLITGIIQSRTDVGNFSVGFYGVEIPTTGDVAIGADNTGNTVRQRFRVNSARRFECAGTNSSGGGAFIDAPYAATEGFDMGVSANNLQITRYLNGTSIGSISKGFAGNTFSGDAIFQIFANGLPGGSANSYVSIRMRFYFIGLAMTDAQVSRFSIHINNLMRSFGANVY